MANTAAKIDLQDNHRRLPAHTRGVLDALCGIWGLRWHVEMTNVRYTGYRDEQINYDVDLYFYDTQSQEQQAYRLLTPPQFSDHTEGVLWNNLSADAAERLFKLALLQLRPPRNPDV